MHCCFLSCPVLLLLFHETHVVVLLKHTCQITALARSNKPWAISLRSGRVHFSLRTLHSVTNTLNLFLKVFSTFWTNFGWLPDFSANAKNHSAPDTKMLWFSQCGLKFLPKQPPFSAITVRSMFKLSWPHADFRFPWCKFWTGFVDKITCLQGGDRLQTLSESLHLTATVIYNRLDSSEDYWPNESDSDSSAYCPITAYIIKL